MNPVLAPATAHPACLFTEPDDSVDPAAQKLKTELIDIIRWADSQNPRSAQKELGPSEIGTPCVRRLAYRLAEIEPVNTGFDPWAAIVGTAIHAWLDQAISMWCAEHGGTCDWLNEKALPFGEFAKGRSDLFQVSSGTVIDHKGAGPDVMRKVRRDGPPPGYVAQVQLYGLGYATLGYDVKRVGLAFYPRAGWLKDMYVWVTEYDQDVANGFIERMYATARILHGLNIIESPHRWEQIDATPSNDCGFCSMYDPGRDAERGADDTGCPGR